ncbi:hypothetical protein MFLAVUS_007500 [Mucor flavus]|uniref:Mitochondrial import inner membrane translocase subunit TIM10 n=1 Tax=Mucor flavus TaxID=439312 RepID=A0ABP9Z4H1_9FUNG
MDSEATVVKELVPLETPQSKTIKPTVQKTIRIHVNTANQPRPVIFNYRQLYKRELKKLESTEEAVPVQAPAPMSALEALDDSFFKELLKKADSYALEGDDVDDVGSDEETSLVGNKKQIGNEYDFEDPFIDDSEMLLDEPQEYRAPEFDGFFVYHGPLDGNEGTEKIKPATPKRKAPAKSKSTTPATSTGKRGAANNTTANANTTTTAGSTGSTATSSTAEKSRKKTTDDHGTEDNIKKPTAGLTSTVTTKTKKPAVSTASSSKAVTATEKPKPTTTAARKVSLTADQPAKKKKKVEVREAGESGYFTIQEDQDKKKKALGTLELKPLDPEIEALMEKLRKDVLKENFENKAKFPLALKPTVLEAGLIMFRKSKTIDENLIHHLMSILPYNRYTLKKFLTTKSGQMRVDELQQEIDELAILLKQTIDKMIPEQQRLYEEKLAQAQNQPANPEEEFAPTLKFKCNDEVRKILYDIIQTEEQSIHIANQVALHKDSEKKNEGLASDNKARKLMYQRLLSCWPEGWMNSYEMSRQYSQYKSKLALLSEKKSAVSSVDSKKRKRVTPQLSPSEEGFRKNLNMIMQPESSTSASSAPSFNQKTPVTTNSVITIDDDDEEEEEPEQPSAWKQSNSMKIEALIKMSYFGGGNQQAQTINPQNIAMAEQELEMVTDLFNRIVDSCQEKCIKLGEGQGDLSQQDSLCIDNCVAKFFETNSKVGEKMQNMSQQ